MKILIVDDNPDNLWSLRTLLEAEGHVVLQADDGVEALATLETQPVDAVISDILMPRMDGYRLCSAMRKDERWRNVPFIFYTATHISLDDEQMALDLGAHRFLKKPVKPGEIVAALAEVLRPAAEGRPEPKMSVPETETLGEYSERLVAKLEENHIELACNAKELRSAHEKLRNLLAASPVVIYSLRVEGQNVTAAAISENLERMLGFTVAEAMEPDWWGKHLHPGDRERMLARLPAMTLEEQGSDEYRFLRKDGGHIWVRDDRRLARDAQGRPVEIIGSWSDVTQRREADEDLRSSIREVVDLQAALDEHAIVSSTDPQGNIIYANPKFCAISKYSREELLGQNHRIIKSGHHPREFMRDLWATISRGRVWHGEIKNKAKDGSYYWVDATIVPFLGEDGQPRRYVAIRSDITERKRAELRTEVQHAVTAVLAKNAPFPETTKMILEIICRRLEWDVGDFWTLDGVGDALRCAEVWHPPSTEFLEFAETTRSMVFLPGEELPGGVWATGEPVWIPDVIQNLGFRRRTVAAKLGLRSVLVFPIKLRSEVLGVLEFFSARALPPDAELLAVFVALGTQIGQFIERKQLEEQFRQSQKMEAIGQLAGGVAHDFNNLLTVIQGYTQILQATENLAPEMADSLQQVFLASERAARLTYQLLAFSRKQVMQLRPVDLNESIAGVSAMLHRIIGEDVALRVKPGLSLPLVQADPGMMEQALMNLVLNARDAMPKGGTLTVETSAVTMGEPDARLHPNGRPGQFVRLRVADTGCGMTPETMSRVFEPFFTTKPPGKGTGLGLATVHGIAQQHQGWVEVESQPGKGTTFKMYFPAAGQIAKAAPREQAPGVALGGAETILLVEDEPALRDLARIILERQGYRILEAGSGVAALSVWADHAAEISLVITDMVMPDGMTGQELAERLTGSKPSLKVIYSTGYSPEALNQNLNLESGLNYLPKPYDPRALVRAVRNRLDT
jgi:PAS domain S-box-containing protein